MDEFEPVTVGDIAAALLDFGEDKLAIHMAECGWAWGMYYNDSGLTVEEIASAAACGFEVTQ